MAITKQKKEIIIKEVHELSEKADMIVFVNFHGLSVADMSTLRGELREAGATLKVAKKRLVKRVLDGFGFSGEMSGFDGEIALFFKEGEPIEAVKILVDFAKKVEGLQVLGGIYEKGFVGMETVKMLASIPPREVLLGQVVGSIASPLSGFVRVINGPVQGFIGVLHNISKSRS
ncbi:MAG: 50S ribosomal protein L10 [Candidatus Niyogibacteria bacterium CG10_big_fil_rev_8_21_14_0_10_46_36]|uniref:Large ribosomal subunit protein uL10 n=1 Tax=Candidatus Niyogibacteria bacterium CG10_big_fil_rev_8_21_14_0_10_46_36 TaxID=1974726 RepID=A0A2H0TDT0_9BACT|nr:MAG: 50S ribosomal protein L10 [Candidatus Niyogibacteria bacterium CG10_big_fil_rev_8_21_14_0_10_46_36]